MNGTAQFFLGLALALSALDWFAVIRRSKPLEYIAKPAAAMAFFASAVTLDAFDESAQTWMAIALVFCVLGDVFLMLPRDAFIPGLAAFAGAQVLLALSFLQRDVTWTRFSAALVVVIPIALILARRFLRALRLAGKNSLVPAIVAYMMVISSMVVGSITSGTAVGVAGAFLFLISDAFIAEQRFVSNRRWQPLTIIVTYHLALAALVLSLV